MSDYAISAEKITVNYGNFSALKDLTFYAETGKIIGLLVVPMEPENQRLSMRSSARDA